LKWIIHWEDSGLVGVLEWLAESRGLPDVFTTDYGPEFKGRALDNWVYRKVVKLKFIPPRKTDREYLCRSFNSIPRD
jgi:putative transposase